jgi:carbon-monoxide dehydrogenase small subunit
MKVTVTVNGEPFTADVEDRMLLVHYVRDVAGLTATNIGCDTTSCGACTVLLDGESVKSCTILAAQADGSAVLTVEGLAGASGELHPMQSAFRAEHGLQCGFCTPGMVMAAVSLLRENPDPTEEQVRAGLEGNLCRCTGYHNIVRAVLAAAEAGAPGAGAAVGGAGGAGEGPLEAGTVEAGTVEAGTVEAGPLEAGTGVAT